jgi:hypothetical protein
LSGDYSQFTQKALDEILAGYKPVSQDLDKLVAQHAAGKGDEDPLMVDLKALLDKSSNAYDLEKKTKAANVTLPEGANTGARWDEEFLKSLVPETPGEAPLLFPWRAYLNGFNVPAYHGTVTPTDFNRFQFPVGELGAHFGTPRAAMDRLTFRTSPEGQHRVYPVLLKPGKTLELPDLGSWGYDDVYTAMKMQQEAGKLPGDLLSKVSDKHDFSNNWNNMPFMRDYLTGKGYTSVKYTNNYEHPGSTSWIMFNPDPASPAHISGIKSPWAKFKDLRSSDILASIAALGLAGTEFAKPKEKIPDNL